MSEGCFLAPTFIVEPTSILPPQSILEENWTLIELFKIVDNADNPLSCLEFLAQRGLINNILRCTTCGEDCRLKALKDGTDEYQWSCEKCGLCSSVRKDSFFSHSQLPLWKLVVIMYGWCRNMSQEFIIREAELCPKSSMAASWSNVLRNVCQQWLKDSPSVIGGMNEKGDPKVVEIDESLFPRKSDHRKQKNCSHLVFGGIERGSGRCFLVAVPDRRPTTLDDVVKKHILPGSRVISNTRRSYSNLALIRDGIFQHDTVNAEHFVNPHDNSIHTQTIKNMWMRVKRQIQHFDSALFPTHLAEFMWRNAHRDKDTFSAFIITLSSIYFNYIDPNEEQDG